MIFSVEKAGTIVDIDNVRLEDADGKSLVRNGDIGDGTRYWFFSSDHHHLPWHAKNLWLGVWFDQGWAGVLLFSGLCGISLIGAVRNFRRPEAMAIAIPAALVTFYVVGLFDSLIDNTRIAVLFYLLAMYPLLKRIPVPARPTANSKA